MLPLAAAGAVLAVAAGVPFGWTRLASAGHLYAEPGPYARSTQPRADVVMVLGAQVAPGGTAPLPYLRGRLDTAAALLRSGRARVVLVSGDGQGASGDETAVMRAYLTGQAGIAADRVVSDPYGLDTYDSCVRARRVFGIRRLLVVTQDYHLARAVTLCRHAGIDTDGVVARCDRCDPIDLPRNYVRDYFACTKAALDVWRNRGPAVYSPPSDAVRAALRSP